MNENVPLFEFFIPNISLRHCNFIIASFKIEEKKFKFKARFYLFIRKKFPCILFLFDKISYTKEKKRISKSVNNALYLNRYFQKHSLYF